MTTLETLRRRLAALGPYRAECTDPGPREHWRVVGAAGRYVTTPYPSEEQALRVAIERIDAAEAAGTLPAWGFA